MEPNPQSRSLLLDIFVKLRESEALKVITEHKLRLSFKERKGMFGHQPEIEFQSPCTFGFSIRENSI
ncbi:MAG: hypothetical protein ACFFCG_08885 [Promethearchaeota archaeon]